MAATSDPQPPASSAVPPLSDKPFEPVETGSRTPSDPVPLIDRPPYDDGNDQ